MKQPSVLSGDNFEAIMGWLSSENQETPPPFAEEFMVTLHMLYMNRTGHAPRRQNTAQAATRLSLTYIAQNPAAATARPPEAPPPARAETLKAIAGSAPATPSVPARKIGDGDIPFIDEKGYREGGLDSLDVAKAIAWHYEDAGATSIRGSIITISFLQTVLYVVYGTFLAERGTRLTAEHPHMWHNGPAFPRVQRKLFFNITPDRKAAMEIREKDPELDEFIPRIIRILAEKSGEYLKHTHTAPSSPWGRCLKANPDKWGIPLDDDLIADWFRKDIEKSRQARARA